MVHLHYIGVHDVFKPVWRPELSLSPILVPSKEGYWVQQAEPWYQLHTRCRRKLKLFGNHEDEMKGYHTLPLFTAITSIRVIVHQ